MVLLRGVFFVVLLMCRICLGKIYCVVIFVVQMTGQNHHLNMWVSSKNSCSVAAANGPPNQLS